MAGGDLKLDPYQAHPSCCQMAYTLNCMILGEKIPFSVKINETQLVDELKDKIKETDSRASTLGTSRYINSTSLNPTRTTAKYGKP